MSYSSYVSPDKKIKGTLPNTDVAKPGQQYISPEARALRDNSSVWGAAKQLQQSAGPVPSYSSTTSNAKNEGRQASTDTQGFYSLGEKLVKDRDAIKEETNSVQARVTRDGAAITGAFKKVEASNRENADIDAQIASLQEGQNSNPFEKPLETMYSLKSAGEADKTNNKTSDGLLVPNSQDTEEGSGSTANDPNKQKIDDLNTKKDKNNQGTKVIVQQAKAKFDASNQSIKAETNEINGKKQEVAKEIADCTRGQQDGTNIAGIGEGVKSIADMMAGSGVPLVMAAAPAVKTAGIATNMAGLGLTVAATGSLAQAQNKSTEIDKAGKTVSDLKQQAALTYTTALKKAKASNVA